MLVMCLKIHRRSEGTLFFAFHSGLFPCDLDNNKLNPRQVQSSSWQPLLTVYKKLSDRNNSILTTNSIFFISKIFAISKELLKIQRVQKPFGIFYFMVIGTYSNSLVKCWSCCCHPNSMCSYWAGKARSTARCGRRWSVWLLFCNAAGR